MGTRSRRAKRQGTLWHQGFAQAVIERGPSSVRVEVELLLSLYPQRADLLFLQREDVARCDHDASMLRGPWPRLGRATLLELKSPSRGFRRGDLIRLLGYGVQYHYKQRRVLAGPSELTLVLVVPCLTPTLTAEIAHMERWSLAPLENGYARLEGVMYTTYVVFTDEVAEAEDDDYLRIFSHLHVQGREAKAWLQHWLVEKGTMENVRHSDDYEEMMDKLLGMLTPEQRLRGLKPEERLAGLTPEEQLLALPDEILRGLSEDYMRSLPQHLQDTIRQRLGHR